MEISQITESLFVGTTPTSRDYDALRELGVALVINMRVESRPQADAHNPPMRVLWLRTFDTPLIPIPLRALEEGVQAALETIAYGGKVFIHCAAGVHRSAALAACLLIIQGYPPESAMTLLTERRPAADPYIWYIRRQIMRFAAKWEGSNQ